MSSGVLTPIKNLYAGLYDGPHATPQPSNTGPIFLGIKNITDDGHFDFSNIRHISEQEYPRWIKRVKPIANDIVFTYEATLNRYAVIKNGFVGCLGRRMALIRPDESKAHSKYLYYYFFSPEWRETIHSNKLSGSTVDRIPLTRFPDFPVRVYSLPTQKKIANTLGAYDGLIENNYMRIDKLEAMARLLYHRYFKVPEATDWEEKPIIDFGKVVTGKTPSKTKPDYYSNTGTMFIKTPDMHGNLFVLNTTEKLSALGIASQKNKTLPAGSICVSCIGTVGVVGIMTEPSQTNQQINTIVLNDDIYREYLIMKLQDSKKVLENLGANGATMTNVNKTKLEQLKVAKPPQDVMSNFHNAVSSIYELILNLQRKNNRLAQARDILLPLLMSGEIEV